MLILKKCIIPWNCDGVKKDGLVREYFMRETQLLSKDPLFQAVKSCRVLTNHLTVASMWNRTKSSKTGPTLSQKRFLSGKKILNILPITGPPHANFRFSLLWKFLFWRLSRSPRCWRYSNGRRTLIKSRNPDREGGENQITKKNENGKEEQQKKGKKEKPEEYENSQRNWKKKDGSISLGTTKIRQRQCQRIC